ncbi:MAG: hypothetical protein Q4A19_05460 [Johnsonella sp.]|nr:hypothetical protein [Johnsonella sp.]
MPKTWIFDLDGTLLRHNGYKEGGDILLPGVKELFAQIPEEDYIIILTARADEVMEETEEFLLKNGIRYNSILNNIPFGERILFNDRKPSGLDMAYAVNQDRDRGCDVKIRIDDKL